MLISNPFQYSSQVKYADIIISIHSYVSCVDCFLDSLQIFHFKPHETTSKILMSKSFLLIESYIVSEELVSDRISSFSLHKFQTLGKDLVVYYHW